MADSEIKDLFKQLKKKSSRKSSHKNDIQAEEEMILQSDDETHQDEGGELGGGLIQDKKPEIFIPPKQNFAVHGVTPFDPSTYYANQAQPPDFSA